MHSYQFYGCRIQSDLELPGKSDEQHSGPPELEVCLRAAAHGAIDSSLRELVPATDSHGRRVRVRADVAGSQGQYEGAWKFTVEDVVTFWGVANESIIRFEPANSASEEHVGFWFVHQVLPMYLSHLKGWSFLHSSAVEVEGCAIVLIAPTMGGKSTLAQALVELGHPLITDDKLPVRLHEGRLLVRRSHEHIRPYRQSEDLGIPVSNVCRNEVPLGHILFPHLVDPKCDFNLSPLKPAECFDLLQNALLFPTPVRAREHASLLALVSARTRAYHVSVPKCLEILPSVCHALVDALKGKAID